MVGSTVANEVSQKKVLAGIETSVGTAATPDHRWLGDLSITKTADLVEREEATGLYDRMVNPRVGVATFAGTYAEDLAFENLPQHVRLWIVGGDNAVSDTETTPGYVRTQSPSGTADNIESATLQYGVDGLGFRSTGVRHNEGTITIDPDDADGVWKFSSNLFVRSKEILTPTLASGTVTSATTTVITVTGAGYTPDAFIGAFINVEFPGHVGQVRQIVDNDATTITVSPPFDVAPSASDTFRIEGEFTAGISIPDYEFIPSYGTQVYIDPIGGTIGTTEVLDRIVSVNLTVANNRVPKRFLNNAKNEVSAKTGRGGRRISGQLRVEFDRFDEYYAWENLTEAQLRIYQEGSVIDSGAGTVKYAQIDLPRIAFSTPTEDARENNMTLTIPFWAYLPESDPILTIETKNELATLP